MPTKSFYDVLTEAIDDISEHGFDSQARVDAWMKALRDAADKTMQPRRAMEKMLRESMIAIYKRLVDNGGILQYHPGVELFTLKKIKPTLHAELSRRIAASANLIKLNRGVMIERMSQRFAGRATSVPKGGSAAAERDKTKITIRKPLARLPFEERRVLIDQGHKLTSAISDIVARDGGALAGVWESHFRQAGYNFRIEHKERDGQMYMVRGNWAQKAGLVKPGKAGYTDDITQPGEEVFCRCMPGSTRIPFADVKAVSRRWYDGPAITIKTVTGREITTTSNHPILSLEGWKAANLFKPGDYVIEISQEVAKRSFAESNQNNGIPTIAQIFSSFMKFGAVQVRAGRRQDFHGDGISDGNIDIVTAKRPLLINHIPARSQRGSHLILSLANFARSTVSLLCKSRFGAFPATCVKGLSAAAADLFAILLSSQFLSLGYAADGNTACNQAPAYCGLVNTKLLGNRLDAHSIPIRLSNLIEIECQASRVVEVNRKIFIGHVYNLQTSSGAYLAEGIVSHNCYYTYKYNLRDIPKDMLTDKGKEKLREVRAKIAEAHGDAIADAVIANV